MTFQIRNTRLNQLVLIPVAQIPAALQEGFDLHPDFEKPIEIGIYELSTLKSAEQYAVELVRLDRISVADSIIEEVDTNGQVVAVYPVPQVPQTNVFAR